MTPSSSILEQNVMIAAEWSIVVKMLAYCTRSSRFDLTNPMFSMDLHQQIPAGCGSDEALDWWSFVPVFMQVKYKMMVDLNGNRYISWVSKNDWHNNISAWYIEKLDHHKWLGMCWSISYIVVKYLCQSSCQMCAPKFYWNELHAN